MSRGLILVSMTAFLMMMGMGVLFPVMPLFVRSLDYSEASIGVLMASYAAMSFLLAPMWGRFSERRGRKLAIMIGLAGFSLGFLLFGLGANYWQFLGARVLGGIFAAATIPAIFAYVTDVSTEENRSVSMGVLGASIGLGVVMGPVFGGVLSMYFGFRMPFFAAAGVGVFTLLLVSFVMPESITPEIRAEIERRRRQRLEDGHTMGQVARKLWPFLGYSFLFATAKMGFESTIAFLVADRFFSELADKQLEQSVPMSVAWLLFGIGIVGILVQGGGLRVLVRYFSDKRLLVCGTGLTALGVVGLGLSTGWTPLILSSLVLALGYALSAPTFSALLSLAPVARGIQGEVQGLNASTQSLGRVAGPLIFPALYPLGIELTYLLAGFLCALALLLPVKWFPKEAE